MADSQIPTESLDVEVQDALLDVFSPELDGRNPRSRAITIMSNDALKALYTYKVNPKYKMVGDHVASHPPLVMSPSTFPTPTPA